jgi:hypothetical protein
LQLQLIEEVNKNNAQVKKVIVKKKITDYSLDNSQSGVIESSENSSSTEDGTSTASSVEAKTRA